MASKPPFPLQIFKFFFLIFPFAISATSFENTTFKLNSFTPNMHDIIYEGDAFPSDELIQLTGNHPNSSGRATYRAPMHLWDKTSGNLANFFTQFSFTIDSETKDAYGDGFTFSITPQGSRLPPDSSGGNLGLVNGGGNSPKSPFFAVEFDTYNNPWDPPHDHVGIDLNSLVSVNFFPWWWSDVKNGLRVEARISYDSISKNVSVLLIDANNTFSSSMYFLVDLRDYLPEYVTFGFSASTGAAFEMHKIHSWDFSSILQLSENITSPPPSSPPSGQNPEIHRKGKRRTWLWFIVVVLALFLVGLVLYGFKLKRNQRKLRLKLGEKIKVLAGPRKFSYHKLVNATKNFSRENLLGRGGFAKVYYGILSGMEVAVKRINLESRELEDVMKEYAAEVNTISQLRHKNLVILIGWCDERGEFLVVYEFMQNNSLDFHLFGARELLTWEKRYEIAVGLAWALHYLQEQCQPWVLHRDIKPNNVLLDSDFNPKLGDFGLARLVERGQGARTTTLIGTEGYMAPEYVESKKPSKEADVYSFGIVVLEIASGKRAIEQAEENGRRVQKILVKEVWKQYGEGNLNFLTMVADARLHGNYDAEQMKRLIVVGLSCAHPNHEERPSIREAIDMLNSTISLPELPYEMPAYGYVAPRTIYEEAMGDAFSERG